MTGQPGNTEAAPPPASLPPSPPPAMPPSPPSPPPAQPSQPGFAPGGTWATPPAARKPSSRKKWVIGCGVLLLLLVLGVGGCAVLLFRGFGAAGAVMSASNGDISGFNFQTVNGSTTIVFQAAQGVDASEGTRLACQVVRPTLASSELAAATWVIVNRAGDVIGSDETACP